MKFINIYFLCFLTALVISLLAVPVIRYISVKIGNYDVPNEIKTHSGKVPLSGGVAVFFSFSLTLILLRLFTSFPTGTLRELRYILIGGFLFLLIGIIDDLKKPTGIRAEYKFLIEVLIALFMVFRGFDIKFIEPKHFADLITVLWIVGISNAFNIIDIMDGLSSSQVFIACIAFFFISLPSEKIYVNSMAIALSGAVLGFIPYNISKKYKIFLGDSGSLFCGFILAVLSLGADYSHTNPLGVYAPVLILLVPIYDTLYVSYMRIKKGISPFKGTKDHFALRLEIAGYSRKKIVGISAAISIVLAFLAYVITRVNVYEGIFIYIMVFISAVYFAYRLSEIKIE